MTWFFIGLLVGLVLNWIYRRVGKAVLGDQKWRQRALAKIDHDAFVKLHDSVVAEYRRRFGGTA